MIPYPKNPAHQRLVDLHFTDGLPIKEAYARLFPKSRVCNRQRSAKRIFQREDVKTYIAWIKEQAAQGSVLSVQEKREWLRRALLTPRNKIRPDSDTYSDLVVSWSRSDSEAGSSESIRTVDQLGAIARDNELSDHAQPQRHEHTVDATLAEILADLATSSHHGKMDT